MKIINTNTTQKKAYNYNDYKDYFKTMNITIKTFKVSPNGEQVLEIETVEDLTQTQVTEIKSKFNIP